MTVSAEVGRVMGLAEVEAAVKAEVEVAAVVRPLPTVVVDP